MTLNASQNEENGKQSLPVPEMNPEGIDASRRRFTRAGIAASGVLLTLTSRPVFAGNGTTCTATTGPSGFHSINASSTNNGPGICNGVSPGYWKTHDGWPCDKNLKFSAVFLSCRPTSVYAKYTLLDLLTKQADDNENLGMHLVAAFLNARSNYNTFLPEQTIFKIFSDWQASGGYYYPKPGTQWNTTMIVDYLKSTMS